MAVYDWPDDQTLSPREMTLGQRHNDRAKISSHNGSVQTTSLPGARWRWVLQWPNQAQATRLRLEGVLDKLSGLEHRLRLWDIKRPRPRGTCNISGVTLSTAAAQFATTLVLAGCGASRTLLAGDWINPGGFQLVRVVDDAVANGSGVMTVSVRHPLRYAIAAGASVVVEKPTSLFILESSDLAYPRQPGAVEPEMQVQMMEAWLQ